MDLGSLNAREGAEALWRSLGALSDPALRLASLLHVLEQTPLSVLARALDAWCAAAEQAEPPARAALVTLVDALATRRVQPLVQRLREEAAGEALLALDRLVRSPVAASRRSEPPPAREERVPDYGVGRPLTLGERKALARKPDRAMMQRLLRDPHPDVIERLLANPKLTEEDVMRLSTQRPCPAEVLALIARCPRWAHRTRIRRALVLNPCTPFDIAAGIIGLLMRQELRLVAEATNVPPGIRALCLEHLKRRPPAPEESRGPLQ